MDSRTELSLFEAIKGGGLVASVITTFNAYLPFYEHVVLPRLRAAGSRHNIVLMDAGECARALSHADTAPQLAGRAYTLVPVGSRGAFHPKLLLLLGRNKAVLHAGSHNLTLAGFGRNAELTGLLALSGEECAESRELAVTWAAILQWVHREADWLPEEVGSAIKATERLVPWLPRAKAALRAATQSQLLIQTQEGAALWEQVEPLLPVKATSVSIVGAFFDRRLSFLTQVQRAMPGAAMRVAIQPKTVSLPCSTNSAERFDWRDSSSLVESGYLHAKALWVHARDEQDLLLIGSANPSAPAWLAAAEQRNDEAMVVLQGPAARSAAESLGLASIAKLPKIEVSRLREIAGRSADAETVNDAPGRTRVCALVSGQLVVRVGGLIGQPSAVLFIDATGEVIARTSAVKRDGELLLFDVDDSVPLGKVVSVRLQISGQADVVAIVHSAAEIADLARTGTQQALGVALEGLDDDAADITELVAIVEKAIFSDLSSELPVPVNPRGKSLSGSEQVKGDSMRPASLVVLTKDMKAPRQRKRLLSAGSDLAYLLNVLFSELRVESSKRDVDRHGRSEEEQIGKDDEVFAIVRVNDAALAKLCQSKAGRLIKRAIRYVEQSAASTAPRQWLSAIVKLTAVLAVLRELRVIEHLPRWRAVHEPLVKAEALESLLEGVLPVLFGRETALLWRAHEALGSESYEELARLKGLLLWLAWDCRVILEDQFSPMDEPDSLFVKLWEKAALLEIAQYLPGEDLGLQEAYQSVMRCASAAERVSASRWLEHVSEWCRQVEGLLLRGRGKPKAVSDTQIGEVAYVNRDSHLRVICRKDTDAVALVDLGSDDGQILYAASRVTGVLLSEDGGAGARASVAS